MDSGRRKHGRITNDEMRLPVDDLGFGDRVADRATAVIGSWRFILTLFAALVLWMIVNTVAWIAHWDPYPFIFLNLVLSFQGAFAAPVILMSQNRQEERDREAERQDHLVNLRAEREITTMLERIEALSRTYQDDIVAIRSEQREMQARLDALLATLTDSIQERDRAL
ncbi:MAG: DUF1003 domain-containing protein [Thermomicrobiales bacterium]